MQVNSISNTNPNFQAKFVMDSKNILRDAYLKEKISDSGRELLYKFSKTGKGQEVEFVDYIKHDKYFTPEKIDIFNRTTGKTVSVSRRQNENFWDMVLSGLLKDKEFFKPNDLWQELTGQKVITWEKKLMQ